MTRRRPEIGETITVQTDAWEYDCCGDLLAVGDVGRFDVDLGFDGFLVVDPVRGADGHVTHHALSEEGTDPIRALVLDVGQLWATRRRGLMDGQPSWVPVRESAELVRTGRIVRPAPSRGRSMHPADEFREVVAWVLRLQVIEVLTDAEPQYP